MHILEAEGGAIFSASWYELRRTMEEAWHGKNSHIDDLFLWTLSLVKEVNKLYEGQVCPNIPYSKPFLLFLDTFRNFLADFSIFTIYISGIAICGRCDLSVFSSSSTSSVAPSCATGDAKFRHIIGALKEVALNLNCASTITC